MYFLIMVIQLFDNILINMIKISRQYVLKEIHWEK